MSRYVERSRGMCTSAGPYDWHCTEVAAHRYSHYDASEDTSWTSRDDDHAVDIPHACDNPACPGER